MRITLAFLVFFNSISAFSGEVQLKQGLTCEGYLKEFEEVVARQQEVKHPDSGNTFAEIRSENLKQVKGQQILGKLNSTATSQLETKVQTLLSTPSDSIYLEVITKKCKLDTVSKGEEQKKKCIDDLKQLATTKFEERNKKFIKKRRKLGDQISAIKETLDYIHLNQVAKYYAYSFLKKNCALRPEFLSRASEMKRIGCDKTIASLSPEPVQTLAEDVTKIAVIASVENPVTPGQAKESCRALQRDGKTLAGCGTEATIECPDGSEKLDNKCYKNCPDLYIRDPATKKCYPDTEAQYAENMRQVESRKAWGKAARVGGIILAAGAAIGLAAWGISAIAKSERDAGGSGYVPSSSSGFGYNPYGQSFYPNYPYPYYNPYMYSYPSWVGYQHSSSNTPYTFEF